MSDLTTLAAVKAYLKTPNSAADDLLSDLITRASAAVENYCQRSLLSSSRVEFRDGTGGAVMLLREYPIQSIQSVVIDGNLIPPSAYALYNRTLKLTGYRFTRDQMNVCITYTAGYLTVPPDVEQACIESVAQMYKRAEHIDVSSKSLQGESTTYIQTDISAAAQQMLNNYKIVAPI